jgi:hypothetical protein
MSIIFEAPNKARPGFSRITAEAFWDRFTSAELVDYEVAAWGDPAATVAKQKDAAKLRIFRNTVNTNGFVILGKSKVQATLLSLESPQNGTTVLAAGRAGEIYSAAITADEAYGG